MKKRILILALIILFAPLGIANSGELEDGVDAYDRGDYKEAFSLLKPLADQGHADAQFGLGVMYAEGEGVPQDHTEAVRWYRKAADQGHAAAQFNLGFMYDKGDAVPQDYKEAMKWYRKAADQGVAQAQLSLGTMYAKGEGVPQDHIKAVKWFRKAADEGSALAQFALGAMYQDGIGVLESPSAAIEWYYKAGMTFLDNGEREMALTAYDAIQEVDYGHFLGRKLQNYLYRIPEEHSSGREEDARFERRQRIEELEAEARSLYESFKDDPDVQPDIRFRAYYDRIWRKIRSSWVIPGGVTTSVSLVTVVGIRIAADGEIEQFWIEEKSGNDYYDQSALRVIRKANPLPPLPEDLGGEPLEMGINFRYPE